MGKPIGGSLGVAMQRQHPYHLCCTILLGLIHCTRSFSLRTSAAFLPPILNRRLYHVSKARENLTPLASSLSGDDFDKRRTHRLPLYRVDTDVMPKRDSSSNLDISTANYLIQDWGIEQQHHPIPEFPDSIQAVADHAFAAVVGTLNGEQCLDPNIASNAMAKNTVVDYRPIRQEHDRGRIGIEIDGAIFIKSRSSESTTTTDYYHESNGSALRHLMLVLAGKFSRYPFATNASTATTTNPQFSNPPVALYFNTVKQAMAASQLLRFLKQQGTDSYDKITIHCLGQGDEFPQSMRKSEPTQEEEKPATTDGRKKRARRTNTAMTQVDPVNGVIIVVQPTDFNDESRPPGPAVGVLSSFQKLVARASAEEVPVVMVSPRFVVDASSSAGWAQGSGGHQASTYGGVEPPRGPTPWIIRDFQPPVYCWVGNAVSLSRKESSEQQQRRRHPQHHNHQHHDRWSSMIALTQSVMDEGHPWHVFAGVNDFSRRNAKSPFQYEYLASTKSAAGRPTRAILRRMLGEFGS